MTERTTEFRQHLDEQEASWGEFREQPVVENFGDPDTEYWAIRREGAGLVDRMERETLVITGDEAVPWLQGLVTNDLVELAEEGSGQWNTVTNVNGRMLADFRVLHVQQMLMLDLEPGTLDGGLMSHLRQQIIMEDVELADRTESTGRIGVFGPAAAEILGRAARLDESPAELGEYDGTWGRLGGSDMIVQMNPVAGEPGFELFFDHDRAEDIWRALEEVGGDQLEPVGHQTMETLRIEAGVPRYGVETTPEVIPLEAEMRDLIDFEKGCYLGQEIIARLDTRGEPSKLLRTLVFDGGAAPAVGASLESGEREVGEVVSPVWSPLLDAPVALAYVQRGSNDIGEIVEVEGREARVEALGYPIDSVAERADAAS